MKTQFILLIVVSCLFTISCKQEIQQTQQIQAPNQDQFSNEKIIVCVRIVWKNIHQQQP
jgi:hypothetical protein